MNFIADETPEEPRESVCFDLARIVHVDISPSLLEIVAKDGVGLGILNMEEGFEGLLGGNSSTFPLEPELAIRFALSFTSLNSIFLDHFSHEGITRLFILVMDFPVAFSRFIPWLNFNVWENIYSAEIVGLRVWWNLLPIILFHCFQNIWVLIFENWRMHW